MPIDEGRFKGLENVLRYCSTVVDSSRSDIDTLTEIAHDYGYRIADLEYSRKETSHRNHIKYLVKECLKEILQDAIKELNRSPSEITLEEFETVLNDTYYQF